MRIVGIDPHITGTGVFDSARELPSSAITISLGTENSPSYLFRSRRLRSLVARIARWANGPDLAVMTGMPIGGEQTPNSQDHCGLWHGIYGALDHAGAPVAVVPPGVTERWVTGREIILAGDVQTVVTAWALTAGESPTTALAAGHAYMGALQVGAPVPFAPKPRHINGLDSVAWPSNLCAKPDRAEHL